MATDSIVEDLEERLNASRNLRRVQEGRWLVNLAMYLDHQWISVDPSGRVFNVGNDSDLPTLQDNRIMPSVRSDIAKMTKSTPVWVGVPANRSDEEIQSARLREDVFDHYWQRLQMRRKLRNALMFQRNCAAGFFKITWDDYSDTGKKATAVFRQGEKKPLRSRQGIYRSMQEVPEDLRDGLEERTVRFGEPCIEVKSPFEILPDALATEDGVMTCEYIGEECIYTPAYLQRRFGGDWEGDAKSSGGTLESRYPGFAGVLGNDRGAAGRKGVKCREYWSLPGIDGPRGKHCFWTAQGKMLFEEELPYPWLPYTMLGGYPAGRFWPEAPTTYLISPQTELNKTLSQIAANAERIGNPPRARPAGSLVEGEDWHGLPGEEIIYEDLGGPNSVPQFLQVPEMPVYIQARIEQLHESIDFIAAHSEVSQGGAPPGVTAASAINLLQEANDTSLGPDIAEMEDACTDLGRKLLWMLARYADDERLLRISGENGAWDIKAWRGNQLRDGGADEVQAGSGIPQSKAAKQAAIFQYFNAFIQAGQAPPPRELRKIMRDMEVGGLEHFFSDVGRTEAQVQEEHRKMLEGFGSDNPQPVLQPIQGAPPDPRTGQIPMQQVTTGDGTGLFYGLPINDFDQDQDHLDGHYEFFRSPRFLELMYGPPQQQGLAILMLGHAKLHEMRLQEAANNQAAAQMTMENTRGGEAPPLDPNALNNGAGSVPSGQPPLGG
jgi:hypothetical protein